MKVTIHYRITDASNNLSLCCTSPQNGHNLEASCFRQSGEPVLSCSLLLCSFLTYFNLHLKENEVNNTFAQRCLADLGWTIELSKLWTSLRFVRKSKYCWVTLSLSWLLFPPFLQKVCFFRLFYRWFLYMIRSNLISLDQGDKVNIELADRVGVSHLAVSYPQVFISFSRSYP